MKQGLLAAALSLAAACAAAAGSDRLCTQGPPAAEPAVVAVAGCAEAMCSAIGDQTLCACKGARDSWRHERRRGAQVLQQWPTTVSPMTGPGAFDVSLADIDGDGQPEWLVARLQGVSNGLGVSHHSLCVVWPAQPGRAPLCRDIREWGALTVLVQESGRRGCSLVDSDWQGGREPGRGAGTYAVAQLLRLQDGRWVPAPRGERPVLRRRLLADFEAERASLPQRNGQRLWYQHPNAQPVP